MSNPHSGNRIAEKSDSSLLCQLKSSEAWAAWAELLKRHASLIMRTVSQFEFARERKNECFLYVSDKLSEGDIIKVKVLEVDRQGRVRLSMRDLDNAA